MLRYEIHECLIPTFFLVVLSWVFVIGAFPSPTLFVPCFFHQLINSHRHVLICARIMGIAKKYKFCYLISGPVRSASKTSESTFSSLYKMSESLTNLTLLEQPSPPPLASWSGRTVGTMIFQKNP